MTSSFEKKPNGFAGCLSYFPYPDGIHAQHKMASKEVETKAKESQKQQQQNQLIKNNSSAVEESLKYGFFSTPLTGKFNIRRKQPLVYSPEKQLLLAADQNNDQWKQNGNCNFSDGHISLPPPPQPPPAKKPPLPYQQNLHPENPSPTTTSNNTNSGTNVFPREDNFRPNNRFHPSTPTDSGNSSGGGFYGGDSRPSRHSNYSSSTFASSPYSQSQQQQNRRSTGNYRNFGPPFNPNLYKNGWLFSNLLQGSPADKQEIGAEEDDPLTLRPAPLLFMFNLEPVTAFFTRRYCFSNHFECERLLVDGISFRCTEQFYMFYKARVFDDQLAMQQIMDTADPKLMKKIGIRVQQFEADKWERIAVQVMVVASVKKYEQNPALRRQLFQTAGTQLVEASPMDERWGIGLSLDDWRLRDKAKWRGKNILGRLLTMLRERLLAREQFAAERQEIMCQISYSLAAAQSVGCLQFRRNGQGEEAAQQKMASISGTETAANSAEAN